MMSIISIECTGHVEFYQYKFNTTKYGLIFVYWNIIETGDYIKGKNATRLWIMLQMKNSMRGTSVINPITTSISII